MPSRRRVLASAAALVTTTTGCLGSDSPAATDRDPRGSASPTTGTTRRESPQTGTETETNGGPTENCQSGVAVRTEPFAPVEQVAIAVDDPARPIVDAATGDGSGGSTQITTYGQAPIHDGVFVRYEGAFYRSRHSEVERESVPARTLSVRWEKGQTAPADAETIPYAALPGSDQRALRLAIFGPVYERGLDRHPRQGLRVSEFPAPYPDGTSDSRLVGNDRTWVEWQDRVYAVRVGGETETDRRTYRYGFERVASSAERFRSVVADEYLFALDSLDDAEREIVESAVDGGYEECEPTSAAFDSLRDRLNAERDLPHPREGEWYVSYDGERYLLDVGGWVV
jgi:hypothetical protein